MTQVNRHALCTGSSARFYALTAPMLQRHSLRGRGECPEQFVELSVDRVSLLHGFCDQLPEPSTPPRH